MNDELPDGDKAEVDPGEIDQFASRMLTAADFWWEKEGGPYKLTHAESGDEHYPFVGVYEEADTFLEAHHGKWTEMSRAFQELHALLEGLSEGCEKVAEQYRNLEELNGADADALDSLIGPEVQESMQDLPKPQGEQGEQSEGDQQPAS